MSDKKIVIKPSKKPAPNSAKSSARPWKVLIVDDDAGILMITEHILKNFIFSERPVVTYSAKSFAEAAALYDQHPDTAVALIDVVMDTADAGLRLVKHIREGCGNERIQLVLRTGQPGHMDQRDILLGYSINDYLNKTAITSQALQNRLMHYLRNFEILQKVEDEGMRLASILSKREEAISLLSNEIKNSSHLSAKLSQIFYGNLRLSQDEQLSYIKMLLSCDEQMTYLLRDLVDSANIEKGMLKTHPRPFSINTAFDEITPLIHSLHKELASDRETELILAADENIPLVNFDPNRCQQIVLNLAINALKRTQRGTVDIRIKTMGAHIYLAVTDTGGQLTQTQLDAISRREPADEPNSHSSTRLDLAAIKIIAEQQNAVFAARSTVDGCEFGVLLPLAD